MLWVSLEVIWSQASMNTNWPSIQIESHNWCSLNKRYDSTLRRRLMSEALFCWTGDSTLETLRYEDAAAADHQSGRGGRTGNLFSVTLSAWHTKLISNYQRLTLFVSHIRPSIQTEVVRNSIQTSQTLSEELTADCGLGACVVWANASK